MKQEVVRRAKITQPVDAEVVFMFQDTEENVILMTKILLRGKALVGTICLILFVPAANPMSLL